MRTKRARLFVLMAGQVLVVGLVLSGCPVLQSGCATNPQFIFKDYFPLPDAGKTLTWTFINADEINADQAVTKTLTIKDQIGSPNGGLLVAYNAELWTKTSKEELTEPYYLVETPLKIWYFCDVTAYTNYKDTLPNLPQGFRRVAPETGTPGFDMNSLAVWAYKTGEAAQLVSKPKQCTSWPTDANSILFTKNAGSSAIITGFFPGCFGSSVGATEGMALYAKTFGPLMVRFLDPGGTRFYMVDGQQPILTITPPGAVNTQTPKITGEVRYNVSTDAKIKVLVEITGPDGIKYADLTATVTDQTWKAQVEEPGLPEGHYKVKVTATNDKTNNKAEVLADLIVDVTLPEVRISPLITDVATPMLTGTASDNIALASVEVKVHGDTYPAVVLGNAWSARVTKPLPENKYKLEVNATDTAGNVGRDVKDDALLVNLDTPTVTFVSLTTNDSTPTLHGTATDKSIQSVMVIVYGMTIEAKSDSGEWSATATNPWSATLTNPLPDRTYPDVTVIATDIVGNIGTLPAPGTLVVDQTHPTVTLTSIAPNRTSTSPIPVALEFSEPVTGFDLGNAVAVIGGTANNLQRIGELQYSFDVTPFDVVASSVLITVEIVQNVVYDLAGNGNIAALPLSRTYLTGHK